VTNVEYGEWEKQGHAEGEEAGQRYGTLTAWTLFYTK
jgi:hypothetical protein